MQERNSNQRNLILEIMTNNYSHPTADQIYEAAREKNPHISRGTVYRNLALLAEKGSVLKVNVPDGPDHYDSTLKQHYHFCCTSCYKMVDTPEQMVIELDGAVEQMTAKGFLIREHNLIFTGLCPECNKKLNKA